MIITFLVWSIGVYGITNILVYGSIFGWLRSFFKKLVNSNKKPLSLLGEFFTDMLGCMMCTGFHVGWVVSLFVFGLSEFLLGTGNIVSLVFDAGYSSGVIWIINSIVEWFEENRPISGDVGVVGVSGTSGVSGRDGTSGVSGRDGTSGLSGTSGTSGRTCFKFKALSPGSISYRSCNCNGDIVTKTVKFGDVWYCSEIIEGNVEFQCMGIGNTDSESQLLND